MERECVISILLNILANHPLNIRKRGSFSCASHCLAPIRAMVVVDQVQNGWRNCKRWKEIRIEWFVSQNFWELRSGTPRVQNLSAWHSNPQIKQPLSHEHSNSPVWTDPLGWEHGHIFSDLAFMPRGVLNPQWRKQKAPVVIWLERQEGS